MVSTPAPAKRLRGVGRLFNALQRRCIPPPSQIMEDVWKASDYSARASAGISVAGARGVLRVP